MFIMPGLVSRGPGCARAHHPGIYTRVVDFDNHQNNPENNQGEVSSSLDLFNCLAACEVQGGAKGWRGIWSCGKNFWAAFIHFFQGWPFFLQQMSPRNKTIMGNVVTVNPLCRGAKIPKKRSKKSKKKKTSKRKKYSKKKYSKKTLKYKKKKKSKRKIKKGKRTQRSQTLLTHLFSD